MSGFGGIIWQICLLSEELENDAMTEKIKEKMAGVLGDLSGLDSAKELFAELNYDVEHLRGLKLFSCF